MFRRISYLCRSFPSTVSPVGSFANWKMFEPRKLRPVSIEPRSADTAVMTPITEKTPIVIPDIVRKDRSLLIPRALNAILMTSFIAERDDGIQAGGAERRDEAGDDAGGDRHQEGDAHEADREHEGEGRHGSLHGDPEQEGEPEADQAPDEADRDGLDQELEQDRAAAGAKRLAG